MDSRRQAEICAHSPERQLVCWCCWVLLAWGLFASITPARVASQDVSVEDRVAMLEQRVDALEARIAALTGDASAPAPPRRMSTPKALAPP
jgi:hypothetical protein